VSRRVKPRSRETSHSIFPLIIILIRILIPPFVIFKIINFKKIITYSSISIKYVECNNVKNSNFIKIMIGLFTLLLHFNINCH